MRQKVTMKNLNARSNFNFAWGSGEKADELRRMVYEGVRRHNFQSAGEFIRYCIRETSKRDLEKQTPNQ